MFARVCLDYQNGCATPGEREEGSLSPFALSSAMRLLSGGGRQSDQQSTTLPHSLSSPPTASWRPVPTRESTSAREADHLPLLPCGHHFFPIYSSQIPHQLRIVCEWRASIKDPYQTPLSAFCDFVLLFVLFSNFNLTFTDKKCTVLCLNFHSSDLKHLWQLTYLAIKSTAKSISSSLHYLTFLHSSITDFNDS